eukprot:TRINITY_DN1263_c1_g2_i1.p1 TRINITY_DN1263_c1_g2~~TRINITY_DN1263_c1_g2_i1.p1  ORF type:complete len:207 (+),score=89.90 TRINITY_DN1263_c1_g2_i1:26-622(+)
MKLKFCGDLDSPDWILREISTLSKNTSLRVKLICAQIIEHILGKELDQEKITKLTRDVGLDQSDVNASIAALIFIISNAVKHEVEDTTLSTELQQLGLPKEHAEVISKSFRDNFDRLQISFNEKIFRLPKLVDVDWRVDYIASSSSLNDIQTPSVTLALQIQTPLKRELTNESFEISADKFRVLLNELTQAQKLMEDL